MLRVNVVIWGLEMSQAAAKKVLSSLSSLDEKLVEEKERAVKSANLKAAKIAERAVDKQLIVNEKLRKKRESIQKRESAVAIQTSILKSKIE